MLAILIRNHTGTVLAVIKSAGSSSPVSTVCKTIHHLIKIQRSDHTTRLLYCNIKHSSLITFEVFTLYGVKQVDKLLSSYAHSPLVFHPRACFSRGIIPTVAPVLPLSLTCSSLVSMTTRSAPLETQSRLLSVQFLFAVETK